MNQFEDLVDETIENQNNVSNNNELMNLSTYSINNNPIVSDLVKLGYNYLYSKRLVSYFHPNNLDTALDYLFEINGKIQHNFINNFSNPECFICGKLLKDHINNENQDSNILIDNNNENNISKPINAEKNLIELENINLNEEEEKEICKICDQLYIKNNQTTLQNCYHSFCKNCWYNFLSVKINGNKLTQIKCLEYECQEKLPFEFIMNIIKDNKELIQKYKNYKTKLDILDDPNKKFCPYPGCDSYGEIKDEKEKDVKCKNGHSFCFICCQKSHGKIQCNEKIDENLEEYAKLKFIKKCPKCGTWTEKEQGCNHITCAECNHQWCWLCNGDYFVDHYNKGKCKGFQFFKPKDDYEIQLAFEGKIQIKSEERQIEYENNYNVYDNFQNYIEPNILFSYKKFLVLLIYIIFGQPISYICISTRDAKYLKYGYYANFVSLFYFISTFLIGFANFIFQIYLNICMFIFFILLKGNLFFYYFSEMIYYIIKIDVFEGRYYEYTDIIYDIATLFFGFFFGCFFWSVSKGYDYVDVFNSRIKYLGRKIFTLTLVLNGVILDLILFPLQFIANICITIIFTIKFHSFAQFVDKSRDLINDVIRLRY
jgi:hypothetical protein